MRDNLVVDLAVTENEHGVRACVEYRFVTDWDGHLVVIVFERGQPAIGYDFIEPVSVAPMCRITFAVGSDARPMRGRVGYEFVVVAIEHLIEYRHDVIWVNCACAFARQQQEIIKLIRLYVAHDRPPFSRITVRRIRNPNLLPI